MPNCYPHRPVYAKPRGPQLTLPRTWGRDCVAVQTVVAAAGRRPIRPPIAPAPAPIPSPNRLRRMPATMPPVVSSVCELTPVLLFTTHLALLERTRRPTEMLRPP